MYPNTRKLMPIQNSTLSNPSFGVQNKSHLGFLNHNMTKSQKIDLRNCGIINQKARQPHNQATVTRNSFDQKSMRVPLENINSIIKVIP